MKSIDSEIKQLLGSSQPLKVLNQWLKEALKIPNLKNPWAMTLSTSCKGRVHSRIVLLKQIKKNQLFFYTNYLSQKGHDLKSNSQASLNFYWQKLNRQIRIEGKVKKTSREESVRYWNSRNRGSQISQWISKQSEQVFSRKHLEELKTLAEKKFKGQKIPCPSHWGGYALSIQSIEFWIEQKHRLHDRFLFEKTSKGWKKQRLFP